VQVLQRRQVPLALASATLVLAVVGHQEQLLPEGKTRMRTVGPAVLDSWTSSTGQLDQQLGSI